MVHSSIPIPPIGIIKYPGGVIPIRQLKGGAEMSVMKVICAFGVMTAAIVLVPFQIIKYMYTRSSYSSLISKAMMMPLTPFSENECPDNGYISCVESETSLSRISYPDTDVKMVH